MKIEMDNNSATVLFFAVLVFGGAAFAWALHL